jgi:hypothetical protein
MLKWTALAVGVAVVLGGCSGNDHNASSADTAMGDVADTTAARIDRSADTTGAAMGATMDTLGNRADTAGNRLGRALDTAASKVKAGTEEAAGEVSSAASSAEIRTKLAPLSKAQVQQLQTALNNDGCDAGTADGNVGDQTVKGVKCGLQKYNIDGNDLDQLYDKLGLDFDK